MLRKKNTYKDNIHVFDKEFVKAKIRTKYNVFYEILYIYCLQKKCLKCGLVDLITIHQHSIMSLNFNLI